MRRFVAIGNITNDLPDNPAGIERVGGGVTYAAVAAHRLGMDAQIITKAPKNHPYLGQISMQGVTVTALENSDSAYIDKITTFKNSYDDQGNRRQQVVQAQETIEIDDLGNFPEIEKGSILFVSPVLNEVNPRLFEKFAKLGSLVVTPQGYFRKVTENGEIIGEPWDDLRYLSHAKLVVLSDEDLSFNGEFDENYLERVRSTTQIVVLTRGKNGLTVYQTGQPPFDISCYPISNDEIISSTGAGDSCATAFTWHYFNKGKIREAATFASLYPALKLIGVGGNKRGIEALPSIDQVKSYIKLNTDKIDDFTAKNHVDSLSL